MSLLNQLRKLAESTLEDCRFVKTAEYFGAPEKTALLLPGGDEKYTSFWVRDAAMMAECGLLPEEELKRYVEIMAACGQNGPEPRRLKNGLVVPPFALADHINYNGRPVFYPGTYCDNDDQGDGHCGFYPPLDDNYYFIHTARDYIVRSGDRAILDRVYSGYTLKERLVRAFEGYNLSPRGLCSGERERFTINWGFTDTIVMEGEMLFASLLRYRSALDLADVLPSEAASCRSAAEGLKKAVLEAFMDDRTGWFWSSTAETKQHDVWGTAFAVYLGITEDPKTLGCLVRAVSDGTVCHGYVRHIPRGEDASPDSVWAMAFSAKDTYQNGGYWSTPLGWLLYALDLADPALAIRVAEDYIGHTERFRSAGAPFEWIAYDNENWSPEENGRLYSGLKYGTSGCLPYAGAARFMKE